MTRNVRTDVHRPSTIIPANYVERMWYSLAHEFEGWPQPPINVDRVIEIQREAHGKGLAMFGSLGQCGVCGAHFKHGTLFAHEPTGELIHMGYDCAAKYECLVDASAAELERDRVHRATAKAIQRERNEEARAAFLYGADPGLATALEVGQRDAAEFAIASDDYRTLGAHAILADLARKFTRFCELSDKQAALALRLYAQIMTPPAERPVDVKMPAPTGQGRVTFQGEIVSVKLHVSEQWGASWKCTIKVPVYESTPQGSAAPTRAASPQGDAEVKGIWLAWGSVARDLLDQAIDTEAVRAARYSTSRDDGDRFERAVRAELRGLAVEVTATLEGSTSRTCDGCEGVGAFDYDGPRHGGPHACKRCKGTGQTGGDPSFAFMKRPAMRVVGLYDHPLKAKPQRAKRTKIPTVKDAEIPQ